MIIGPRICYITDSGGANEETIEIMISCEETSGFVQGDPGGYEGIVNLKSDDRDDKFRVYATDEILMVGRLVKLAGSYLLGECKRTGRVLSTGDRPEVTTPFDLF